MLPFLRGLENDGFQRMLILEAAVANMIQFILNHESSQLKRTSYGFCTVNMFIFLIL